jgi:hypothetical protein
MEIDYKRLYGELFTIEMEHLVDLVVTYGAAKDNFSVDDLKSYWDHDGISPMVTDFLEAVVKQNDCPDEIKAQVEILRKFW